MINYIPSKIMDVCFIYVWVYTNCLMKSSHWGAWIGSLLIGLGLVWAIWLMDDSVDQIVPHSHQSKTNHCHEQLVLTLYVLNCSEKHKCIISFAFISLQWECQGSWNLSSWKSRPHLSNNVNAMGSHQLATLRSRTLIQYEKKSSYQYRKYYYGD